MEISKNEIKCWHLTFLISNGLNLIYSLFLMIIFIYFVSKNKLQDSLTICFIFFFIFYVTICTIGHLWTKKSLCINYLYTFGLFLVYFTIIFFEWAIIIDMDFLRNLLLNLFKNSNESTNLLYGLFTDNYDDIKIGFSVNSCLFVKKIIYLFILDNSLCDYDY